jgi:putative transposase
MITPTHKLPISRQTKLLGLARSTAYYQPKPVSDSDLALMAAMDRLHLDYPFAGARGLRDILRRQGFPDVGRRHITTLMKKMGIEAIYRKPNTSKRHPGHKIYPYLLRGLKIDRPDQVWALDITYLPMRRGFLFLVAVMDWYSRKILSWRLSNTMHADFCIEALQEAITRYGEPEIVNTDQGSQFTCREFIEVLKTHEIAISMDGKGCWRDNVLTERFWRTIKYQEVYLKAYESASDARANIRRFIDVYNSIRGHSSWQGQTPDSIYFNNTGAAIAA